MRAKLAGAFLPAVIALAPLATLAHAEDRSPIAITDVRHEASDRQTKIAVECSGPIAYTYYSPDPLTLVIDLPGVDASKVPSRIAVGSHEVEAVRVSSMAKGDGAGLARVEVRMASLAPFQIATEGHTLAVVFDRAAAVATDRTANPAEAVPAPEPAIVAAAAPEREPEAEPAAADAAAAPVATHAKPAPGARASRITSVTRGTEDGQMAFSIHSDGSLKYQDFFLGNPDRLVVDFKGVTSGAPMRPIEVNEGPVRKVRLAQFSVGSPKVARLVVDLSARSPYRIVDSEDGVKVVFGEGRAPSPAPLAALKQETPIVELAPAPPAPRPAQPSADMLPAPALPAPMLQDAPPAQAAPQAGNMTGVGAGRQYVGHPISLDFKDGDLQDIFRLFADISGLNVVVNPGIAGKVTLKLTEVPWDQALDLILKANGLGYTLENNVIRIARIADLQKEEQDLRKLAEEKALTGNLADFSKSLSYAKAENLSDVIKKAGALSARGSITLDPRTNTMLIRDLPAYIEKARLMIEQLDIATPQVEIEARIVVTSRNFTRDLGIQWGFNQSKTAEFGNTTGLSFPNSAVINGGGVPSNGGIAAGNLGPSSGIGSPTRGYAVNLPAAGFNSAIGVTLGNIAGNFNLDVALTALERQGRGRLLSTPKVTTQNNQPAEIKQGVQIPIQTVSNNTVTVSFKDAVLTLKVTPQITEAGTVILQLEVENNAADFANLVNGIPPINTQSAKTIVLVRDGATAVIGGIYQSNEQTAQQSTPFLGKLPILGYLFRNRFLTSTNNELLLFITPRIIKG
jgi:type IV pilus secretin PilQ/predicted competence protein